MNIKEPVSPIVRTNSADTIVQSTRVTIVNQKASQIKIKSIDWLWPQRIACGKLCLIVGNPGVGKSQLTAKITATITTGGEFPDQCRSPKGKVIFISAEDDAADTIVPRLTAAGADLELVNIIAYVLSGDASSRKEIGFCLTAHLSELEDLIIELGDIAAIVIDPITAYLGKMDSNNNSDVRSILSALSKLAEKYNIAIICISHNNKNASQQAIHRAIGSIGFVAACRSAYVVMKDNDDEEKRLFLPLKNNNGNDKTGLAFRIESVLVSENIETSKVVWLDESITKTADEVMSSSLVPQDKSALEEAEEFLGLVLEKGPLPSTEIKSLAKTEDVSNSTLLRAKDKLGIKVFRKGFGKGSQSFWALPSTL